ncbi:MBL fold metallo-hydrolase [Actinomycetospora sp. NBRC 106378]|jgi:cyclase|uniref:MBL fold metallo-hydrolase n=1 Tax=Actinomycetospora sp. NBRC 106378 TaxID=3032208 RepID=UPI0024A5C4E0|nr:MBL fold metallo-hydrolase [Actinomycetospora sp. NBRC 106378]GLZ55409.1 MBL fold metallo-hydrolase [Actinomycetospora sp. NBRC 106378]
MTLTPSVRAGSAPPSPQEDLQEVADGVFAAVAEGGGWCVSNAGLIVGEGRSVLVDTAATARRARRLRGAVGRVVGGVPDVLVNTHHHGDHVFGNAAFAPGSVVVAHERTRQEMAEAGFGLRTLWPDVDWGEDPLVLPDVTFADRLTLWAGELRVELIHVGPAHTTNDVVVWVPDRKVLLAGDVAMSGVTPYCLMGSVSGSLTALDRLAGLGATTVVCGHGPVGGPEILAGTARYLRWVEGLAREGAAAGLGALEIARAADLGEFADLVDPERLVGNLHRALADQADPHRPGRPLDVGASFREMVAFHGGLPDCHA